MLTANPHSPEISTYPGAYPTIQRKFETLIEEHSEPQWSK
jgi:hypothetical protein